LHALDRLPDTYLTMTQELIACCRIAKMLTRLREKTSNRPHFRCWQTANHQCFSQVIQREAGLLVCAVAAPIIVSQ